MNSIALPSRYFGTHRQGFDVARLTWPAYGDGRKREYCSVCKDHIIVASTCSRSVQFGCYMTWLWITNCASVMTKMLPLYNFTMTNWASVMTKMLPLYNFTIPCRDRRAWKTSHSAHAHLPEAISDWLNPLSLGTMSASAYIENLA